MSAATKKCPDCAEQVLAEALKCTFCGYRFDEAIPLKVNQVRPPGAHSTWAILLGSLVIGLSLIAAIGVAVAGWDDIDHGALIGWSVGTLLSGLLVGVVLFLLADIRDAIWFLAWREQLRANEEMKDRGDWQVPEVRGLSEHQA
jgi:Uncharacterised protein family UPF0547